MTRILLPDAFIITQTAAVRALGPRGYACHVAWPYGRVKKLFKSRHIARVIRTTERANDPAAFAQDILAQCRLGKYDVVLPVTAESTEALLPIKSSLDGYAATLLPTKDQFLIGADKLRTRDLCESMGIAYPKTWVLREPDDLDRLHARLRYPVIAKHPQNLGGSRGVRFAGNYEELKTTVAQLRRLSADASEILVQEHVPGHLFDSVTVARDGMSPGVFTSARKLMYPISGGVSCISVSTDTRRIKEIASRIIRELRWNGPIEIEFKFDTRDHRFKLIEINPRFWASLETSLKCGVNFALIAANLALGRDVETVDRYDVGVRHKFLIGRVPFAYWQLARVRGLRALRDPQRYQRTINDLHPFDPMPDLFRSLLVARDLLTGRFPRPLTQGAQAMLYGLENPVPYV